ncbi:hypothetical protein [Streptomyces sp. 3214.6]|uniref:hypothetical protein n=1 Tax=Streptomyces sp. 3214.6 TaxID=1882757 RepID=UPI00090B7637|nr:hypothetical protein [Streptomyces sp. 3214.6]SHI66018.1 hypothetical protein SAMN05444521_8164 [Streptomyces sp. 3214.6]
MTPTQVYVVGAIGGLSMAFGLIVFVGLALAVHAAVTRLTEIHDARRERRRAARAARAAAAADLSTCRAIEALGTPDHTTE